MHLKLPFKSDKAVAGEATVEISRPIAQVFSYIGEQFFENYPKWAVEVSDFQALDGKQVFVGAKAKQIRRDYEAEIESIFEITAFKPNELLVFQGINQPYKHSYLLTEKEQATQTRLTFRFELMELEVFMRPFEKLIRCAIEDGAEATVTNIAKLVIAETNE